MLYIVSKVRNEEPGVRIVDLEDNAVVEYLVSELEGYMSDGAIEIGNAVLDNGKLRMVNGPLNGYGEIVLTDDVEHDEVAVERYVILEELMQGEKIVGYTISNALGVTDNYGLSDLIGMAKRFGFANGEYVNKSGNIFMLPSERPYPRVEVSFADAQDEAATAPVEEAVEPVLPESDEPVVRMIIMNEGVERSSKCNLSELERGLKLIGYANARVTEENGVYTITNGVPDTIISKPADVLVELVLPENVELGENALALSRKLRKLVYQGKRIGKGALMNCASLERVECPNVEVIDDLAFFGDVKLFDFIFPAGLREIGYLAFDSCALIDAKIPSTVEIIRSLAFSNNHQLRTAEMPIDLMKGWVAVFSTFDAALKKAKGEKVKADVSTLSPETAENMGIFTNCENLLHINLARKDVLRLENFQFKGCVALLKWANEQA